jgi:hypothetical protein
VKKKRQITAAELANDPSLRWHLYNYGEALWSDGHKAELRFVGYEGDKVRLATLDGIRPLPAAVPCLSVRRFTAAPERCK